MIGYAGGRTEGVELVINEILRDTYREMHTEVEAGAEMVERAIKKKLTGPRSGEFGTIDGVPYRKSAPGEPPAFGAGDLHDSVTHTEPKRVGSAVESEVGPDKDYASVLEFGGRNETGGRVLPRPFVRPAIAETSPHVIARWRRAFR